VESVGVTNAVDPFEGNLQTTSGRPCLESFDYGSRFQSAARSLEAEKNLPMETLARELFQIVLNRPADLIGQGKLQRLASLALPDENAPDSPLYIVERESDDVTGAQSVRC